MINLTFAIMFAADCSWEGKKAKLRPYYYYSWRSQQVDTSVASFASAELHGFTLLW